MNQAKVFVQSTSKIIFTAVALLLAAITHASGSDLFYFKEQSVLANQGVESNATGKVTGLHSHQGLADVEKFDFALKHLAPLTSYEVEVLVDGGSGFVPADAFMTDRSGSAVLHYQRIVDYHGVTQANGNGKRPLPDQMNPVNMVIGVAIVNTNSQPVLAADLLSPASMQILIIRNISTAQVPASMTIAASNTRSTVKITASNLIPNAPYALALNNQVAATGNASALGKLSIQATFPNPDDVLHLFSVSLLDGNNSRVTGTMLP
ncbi:MAG TPA: hypothetical protein VN625_08520 [Desulfuromonadaceae bacterium]|nr:hypothetical protein [Desulfuromonadaceae bacterium]